MRRGTWFYMCVLAACRPSVAPDEALAEPAAELRGWHYRAEVDPGAKGIAVQLCFEGRPPRALVPIVPEVLPYVGAPHIAGSERSLAVRRGRLALDGVDPGECVAWHVDFEAMAEREGDRTVTRIGDSMMVRQSMWLLWPIDAPDNLAPTIELRVPEGMRASVPWRVLEQGEDRTTFVLDDTVSRWLGYTVLGELDVDRFERAGAEIEIVRLDKSIACDREGVRRWIVDAVDSVALLYDGYPRDHLQVIIVPVDGGGGTVYFGAAARGGGASVYLLLDTEAQADRLPGGWTTVHELLHHGMPFVDDAWMSEGFVSYYTEVMRTRAGHRSEQDGWWELWEAFERGRNGGRGMSLRDTSDRMHETHAYQNVYWGGAAIAFDIDVTMRRESNGARGLDDAVKHLRTCCGDAVRRVPAKKLLAELDAWYGKPIFTQIAERHLADREFADIAALYAELGITIGATGVTLDDRHPAAAIRRAIMAPRKPVAEP
jgi:hypothetical protein